MATKDPESLLESQLKFIGHADKRIDQVWTTHRYAIGSLSTILILGVGLAAYLLMTSISDMRERFEAEANVQLSEFRDAMEADARAQADSL